MRAVILAAGKSTRTYPLTLTKPKPMLKAANKPLLEHNLGAIKDFVSEAIIVVGYKKEMIEAYFGSKYKSIKIKYVEQKEQLGTAHAISLLEPHIKGKFLLLMGDDLYSKHDIKRCIKHDYSIMVAKTKNPQNFGVVVERNDVMEDLIEKPQHFVSDLISTALYVLDRKIFECIKKIEKSSRGEFELPDAVRLLSKKEKIRCVKSMNWISVGYPWDLLNADISLRKGKNSIGKNSKITGNAVNSSIGGNCIIKGSVKNSIIMDNTIIEEKSSIENSVIGEDVYFEGRIIAKDNAYSSVKGKKVPAGRLGAIIGDNTRIMNSTLSPGVKVWPDKTIISQKIKEDFYTRR